MKATVKNLISKLGNVPFTLYHKEQGEYDTAIGDYSTNETTASGKCVIEWKEGQTSSSFLENADAKIYIYDGINPMPSVNDEIDVNGDRLKILSVNKVYFKGEQVLLSIQAKRG